MVEINLGQPELARLELRRDLLDKMQVSPFRFRIIGVAGHRDITAAGLLVQRGAQFTAVEEPLFQVRHCLAAGGAPLQIVKQWRDLRPVSEINTGGNEPTRLKRWQ